MKIALIGSTGQLGTDIIRVNNEDNLNYEIFELSHDKIEITNFENSYNILKEIAPDLVINTAAFHKVDACEKEQEKAYKINTIGIRNIRTICNRIKASIMHISTDYVFEGKKKDKSKGSTEFDQPNPLNIYCSSKLEGKKILKTVTQEHYIFRTAWLFGKGGSKSKGGNFVTTMLRLSESRKKLSVVSDQVGSSTNTRFSASQLLELAKHPYYGTYHAVCQDYDLRYAIDSTKIKSELHWQPRETFETGLRKTIKWYLNNKAWVNTIKTDAYKTWLANNYDNRI